MPSQSRLDGEGTSVHEMTRLSPEVLIVVGDGSSVIAPTKPCIRIITMAKMGGRHTRTILMPAMMPAMCTNNIMSHHKMEKFDSTLCAPNAKSAKDVPCTLLLLGKP